MGATQQTSATDNIIAHHKTIIIGTGFGGLATAYYLQQANENDYIMLERAHDVGGVWRDNSYPGCACDVQSHLYSFSFNLNPNWSNQYSPQEEIYAYLQQTARDFGILPHVRLNTEVTRMDFCKKQGLWTIQTSQGTYTAQHVVGGFGSLSDPAIPDIKGLDSFEGQQFHSATWPKDYDASGKKVAVIGTGASALQFIPQIQPLVERMQVFQRTPSWVLPRHDDPISESTQKRYKATPKLMQAERLKLYSMREKWVLGFLNPVLMASTQRKAKKHLKKAIKDKALRKKLTPNYTIGCKRILLSNTYYPALASDNVDVVTDGIKEITKNGIIANDGKRYAVDTIIFGTGFQVKDLPFSHFIHNSEGKSLAQAWQGTPESYMGTTLHGFPNLYLLHGPNIGLGHTSVVIMMEAQAQHIVGVIKLADKKGYKHIQPTEKAQNKFQDKIAKDMKGTVWVSGGCASWYLDNNGKNSTIWPNFTFTYRKMANNIIAKDYEGS